VVDGRLAKNPAEHVKLPKEHARKGGQVGVVDDPKQFLTPVQVSALVAATPWPYNVLVHVAAWACPRAGELDGRQVGDVDLPDPPLNPNAPAKPGSLHVQRAARALGAALTRPRPTGVPVKTAEPGAAKPGGAGTTPSAAAKARAHRQAEALAELSVTDAEERLVLDWTQPLRHPTFYKAVFRPAVLRANRFTPTAS
jgi:hypothetical protein